MNLLRVAIVSAAAIVPLLANAKDTAESNVALTQTVTFPFGFVAPVFGAPPNIGVGVSTAWNLKPEATPWIAEGGLSIPFTAVTPSAYVSFGPCRHITNSLSLGEKVSWKGTPRYGDEEAHQTFGAGLAASIKTSFGSVILPLMLNCSVEQRPQCSGSISVKTLFRIEP